MKSIFSNGFYINGFIRFSNSSGSVGIPFTGFHGDWLCAPCFDSILYNENSGSLYIACNETAPDTFLYSHAGSKSAVLGGNMFKDIKPRKEYIVLYPNGDSFNDSLGLCIQTMRSISNLKAEIKNESSQRLVNISWSDKLSKFHLCNYGNIPNFSSLNNGKYTITFSGDYIYPYEEEVYSNSFTLPFVIDTQKPLVTDVSVNENTLFVTASYHHYIQAIAVTGTTPEGYTAQSIVSFDHADTVFSNDTAQTAFDISIFERNSIKINVFDYALNSETGSISDFTDDVRTELKNMQYLSGMTFVNIALINQTETPLNGKVIIAFYDESGCLINISSFDKSFAPGEKISADFRLINDIKNAETLKWFV